MASTSIKATYSLDPETVRLLERTARRWSVSKSEALRRAIRAAASLDDEALAEVTLDRLQQAAGLTSATAATWARDVRAERGRSQSRRGAGR
jgi:hypothetical protein